jgi:hypothetical protein
VTAVEVVDVAQRAARRAESELGAAKQALHPVRMQLARLHWEATLRDLHRVLVAVAEDDNRRQQPRRR